MKNLIFIFVVLLTFSQIALTSCDKEDDETINPLFGSWIRENSVLQITFTFNPDFTGNLKDSDANTNNVIESFDFDYSLNGNEITVDWGGGDLSVWKYRISGNKLSLEEEPGSGNFRDYTKF